MVFRSNHIGKLVFFISLLLFGGLIFIHNADATELKGIVNEPIVNIRSGPSTSNSIVTKVKQGDKLTILSEMDQWSKVKLSNGKEGWIANWLFDKASTLTVQTVANSQTQKSTIAVVNSDLVNVRSGPATTYKKVAQVYSGQVYNVVKKEGEWLQIEGNGISGWIAGWLMEVKEQVKQEKATDLIVTGNTVNLRSGPSTSNSIVGKVTKGEKLIKLAVKGNWYKVQVGSVNEAWIADWLVQPIAVKVPSNPPVVTQPQPTVNNGYTGEIALVTGNVVNVRQSPNTISSILGKVKSGDQLKVIEQSGDWYKILLPSGKQGWIASWLVSLKSSTVPSRSQGTLPEVPAQPERAKEEITIPISGTAKARLVYQDYKLSLIIEGLSSDKHTVEAVDNHNDDGRVLVKFDANTNISVKEKINKWGLNSFWISPYEDASAIELIFSENYTYKTSFDSDKKTLVVDFSLIQKPASVTSISVSEGSFSIKGDNRLTGYFEKVGPSIVKLVVPHANITSQVTQREWPYLQGAIKTVRVNQEQDGISIVFELTQDAQYTLISNDKELSVVAAINQGRLSGRIVVLDPGHGSIKNGFSDPGAVGPLTKLYERDVVLDIAQQVRDKLVAQGATVIMTRTTANTNLTLQGRAEIANEIGADIFVSIHANASTKKSYSGSSTYFYAPSNHEVLASQRWVRQRLASTVQRALVAEGSRKDLGIMEANFAVLRETSVPSILVETAFISNPDEEYLFATSDFRNRLATGIAKGIENFLLEI